MKKHFFAGLVAVGLVASLGAHTEQLTIRSTRRAAIIACRDKVRREQRLLQVVRYALVGGVTAYALYSWTSPEEVIKPTASGSMRDFTQDQLNALRPFADTLIRDKGVVSTSRLSRMGTWLKDAGKGVASELKNGLLLAVGYSLYDRIFNAGDVLWFVEKRTKIDQHLLALQEFAHLYEQYKDRARNTVELDEGRRQIVALCSTLVEEFELLLGFMYCKVEELDKKSAARVLANGLVDDFRSHVNGLLARISEIMQQKNPSECSLKEVIKTFTQEYYKPLLSSFARF